MATKPTGYANTQWTYTGNTSSSSSSSSRRRSSSSGSSSSSSGSGAGRTAGQQAEAGMSAADQAALAEAGAAYNSAKTQAEKDAAHAQAEAIRAKYGYSGGTNGAGYTATTTTTPTPAPSSGSRDRAERGSGSAPSATQTNRPATPTNPIAGATQTTVKHADGTTSTAYILNGRTVDANGNAYGFQNGDEVSTGGGTYVWNNGSATLKQNTPKPDNTPASSGGQRTIAQMVAESGGKMTPEIALADPNIETNEDGTMFYEWVTGQWYPIESMNVPTYLSGGYTLNSATGEVNDMGQQTRAYADGSGSTVVNGPNQNAQIGSVLQQLGFEEEAKPYLEAAERDRLAALEAQMAGGTPTADTPVNQPAVGPEGATPTTVLRNGQEIPAWILNGRTVDANGNLFQFQNGDIVNTGGGRYLWNGNGATLITDPGNPTNAPLTENFGRYTLNGEPVELYQILDHLKTEDQDKQIEMLDQWYEENIKPLTDMVQASTDKGVAELLAQLENGLTDYDKQRAQAAITQARAANNAALRNAAAGDMGGIGQKQYSAEQNSYDQQMLSIQLEQINFQNTINQQIAQLEAEGRYQEAQILSEWGQQKVNAFQNQIQWYWDLRYKNAYDIDYLNRTLEAENYERQTAANERDYNRALQRLQLGMFSEEDAKKLGMDPDDAKEYAEYIGQMAALDLKAAQADLANRTGRSSGGGGSSRSGSGSSGGSGGNYYSGLLNPSTAGQLNPITGNYQYTGNAKGALNTALDMFGIWNGSNDNAGVTNSGAGTDRVINPHDSDQVSVPGYGTVSWGNLRDLVQQGVVQQIDTADGYYYIRNVPVSKN